MKSKHTYIIGALTLAFSVIGCQTPSPGQEPLTSAGAEISSTVTAPSDVESMSREKPTRTVIPTLSATPPLDMAYLNDLLFGRVSPDCQLPCWNGLIPGNSSLADIQNVMDTVFEFNGVVDFSTQELDVWETGIPDEKTVGNIWYKNEDYFILILEFVTDPDVLRGIWFAVGSGEESHPYSSQQIVQHLGQPDFIAAKAAVGLDGQPYVDYLLAYQNGVFFHYLIPFTDVPLFPDPASTQPLYCLDQIWPYAEYFIVEPFVSFSAQDATPLQNKWFFETIEKANLEPIEDALGISLAYFTEVALSDTPCLQIPLTE